MRSERCHIRGRELATEFVDGVVQLPWRRPLHSLQLQARLSQLVALGDQLLQADLEPALGRRVHLYAYLAGGAVAVRVSLTAKMLALGRRCRLSRGAAGPLRSCWRRGGCLSLPGVS